MNIDEHREYWENQKFKRFSRITTLTLLYYSDGPVDLMCASPKSLSNLKVFYVLFFQYKPNNEVLRALMINFNFEEVLQLSGFYKNFDAKKSDLIQADCSNVKLIE